MFGTGNDGRKYNLTFSAQALNLFNNIDYGTPTGTVIPTPIRQSDDITGYAGNAFRPLTRPGGQIFFARARRRGESSSRR